MTTHEAPDAPEAAPDADLVLRSRSGDADAFGELWRRHYRSGVVVARSVSSTIDPDDLVQEAYARIFQAIRRGHGPSGSFRAYLFTAIRNTAAAWGRAARETAIDELDTLEDPETTDEATIAALDRSLTHSAFRSLPTRWQEVLWYTEIEQMKPSQVAPLLAMKPVAVAQLASRAREGLREAWIQAHLNAVEDGSECQWAIEHLGAHTRGNLGVRNRTRLDAHLADCARCTIVAGEAHEVGSRLALVLLPLSIGVSATAAYLASLQRGDAAAVALAAMPSSVVEGAVVAVGGAAAGVSGGASGGPGGPGAGGSASAWTVGGLVAAGATALTVAGVVVAASLGLFPGGGSAATTPAAGENAAPPSTEVEASPELIDETPAPEDASATPKPDETDAAKPGPSPTASSPAVAPPSAQPTPSQTPDPAPTEAPTDRAQLAMTSAERTDDGAVALAVTGEPNSDVQAFARSDDASGDGGFSVGVPLAVAMASDEVLDETTLSAEGTGTLVFELTRAQAQADVTIEVVYAGEDEGIAAHRLSELGDIRTLLLDEPEPDAPTPTPTDSPSGTPTPEPTDTPEPTPTPTETPTATPTPEPTPVETTPPPTAQPDVWASCGDGFFGGLTCVIGTDDRRVWGSVYLQQPNGDPERRSGIAPGVPIEITLDGNTPRSSVLYIQLNDGTIIHLGALSDLMNDQ
jgi:RNA polymerase sigma factor (sigma-70 family)